MDVAKIRKSLVVGAVVAVAGCLLSHAVAAAPCEATGEAVRAWPRPPASKDVLHMVTWNLHGIPLSHGKDGRLEHVAGVLLDREPDLVVLQEIWLKKDAQLLGRALWSRYLPIADGNKVTDAVCYKLGGRKGGLLAFHHRMSQWVVPGATVASSFRQFQARAPWFRLWQADGISGKGIQRIELKQNGYRVVVLNTHLQFASHAGCQRACESVAADLQRSEG